MTNLELDVVMRRVLLDSLRNDEAEDCIFAPSKHYLREMKYMLKYPAKWQRNRTKPVWKQVVRWVLEVYETHVTYRFSGEDISGPMPQYGIADLPEGYVETDRTTHSATVSIMYENDAGGILCLDYAYMQEGTGAILTTKEGDELLPVTIGGFAGQAGFAFRAGFMAYFEKAIVEYSTDASEPLVIACNGKSEAVKLPDDDAYHLEIQAFAQALNREKACCCTPGEAAQALEICLKTVESLILTL